MRRFLRIATVAFICGILIVPPVEAQNRRGSQSQRTERSSSSSRNRPSNNSNSGRNSSGSQSNRRGNQSSENRPGNSGNNTPSNKPNNSNRPSNSNHPSGNNNRPNNNRPSNSRPASPSRPNNNRPGNNGPHAPAIRPGRPQRPSHMAPPPRPHRPVASPWSRPLPPQSWRPYRGCPVINSILGITFGTTIAVSLDYLFNQGYTVDGYNRDVVYLRDVSEMSYFWPDATLYYNSTGLERSEFIYSTGYNDNSRYNNLYTSLVAQYGSPVSYRHNGNTSCVTWFGYNNGYISLEYRPMYTNSGALRYYTTLTYGN